MTKNYKDYSYKEHSYKKYQNEKDDSHMINFGLVLMVLSTLVGTGLLMDKCTKTIEQKVQNYYNQNLEQEYQDSR